MGKIVSEFLAHDEAYVGPDPILLVHDAKAEARVACVQGIEDGSKGGGFHLDPGASPCVGAEGGWNENAHQAGTAVVSERI